MSTRKTVNIYPKIENMHTILHTCNIVYIIKSMNIGIQQKIKTDNIQYTKLDVPPTLWNIYIQRHW